MCVPAPPVTIFQRVVYQLSLFDFPCFWSLFCILQLDRSLDDVMTNIPNVVTLATLASFVPLRFHFQLKWMIQCCVLHPKKATMCLLKSESSYSIGLFPTSSKQDHFSSTCAKADYNDDGQPNGCKLSDITRNLFMLQEKSNKCCQFFSESTNILPFFPHVTFQSISFLFEGVLGM